MTKVILKNTKKSLNITQQRTGFFLRNQRDYTFCSNSTEFFRLKGSEEGLGILKAVVNGWEMSSAHLQRFVKGLDDDVRETLVKDLDGLEAGGVREEVLRYCQNMFKEEKRSLY